MENISQHSIVSWLSDTPSSSLVTTNQLSVDIPFQRWYRFKEAFSPFFVRDALSSLPRRPRHVLDPFGGSGTTALTCQFLGIDSSTIEVNPFLADLIASKLNNYKITSLISDYEKVLSIAKKREVRSLKMLENGPKTLFAPGIDDRWIFDRAILKRILCFREAIYSIKNKRHRILFLVILGSILIPLSNVRISGKGRKYRLNWQNIQRNSNDVDKRFTAAFNAILEDIARYADRPKTQFSLLKGDCRRRLADINQFDYALFSPPYPNSFDYTDIYNVELWTLGYLKSGKDNRSLRNSTLRSHVQIKRDYGHISLGSKTLSRTTSKLRRFESEIWNKSIPDMVGAYFGDLCALLEDMRVKIDRAGSLGIVVGDSSYAGIKISVEKILTELSPQFGFECVESNEVRFMHSSAQQGRKKSLGEHYLRLRPI